MDVSLDLDLRPGEVVALVGPNGAGKTTLLKALMARRPDAGLVFQDLLLFPHLCALDNVAFGLRRRGQSRSQSRAQARQWLERLGVGHVADQRPSTLSGGEAQRVAIARTLVLRPNVLLLDEPFAALDAAARPDVRRAVRAALAECPGGGVVVTHQPVDVLALAQRAVVLEAGRIVQDGPVDELRARPRSRWAAEWAGVNLLEGEAVDNGLRLGGGLVVAAATHDPAAAGPAYAVVHPHSVTLSRTRPETSARNVWAGTVADVDQEGDRARVRVQGPVDLVAEVTPSAVHDLDLAPGAHVWASVKATEVEVYPA
jgi:molybdate transport system ATP-binding protein